MKASIVPKFKTKQTASQLSLLDKIARAAVLNKLQKLSTGRLTIIDQYGRYEFGDQDETSPHITLRIQHMAFYSDIAFTGSLGAGESYMRGEWSCDDLTGLVKHTSLP